MADNDHDADDGSPTHNVNFTKSKFSKLAAGAGMSVTAFAEANIHAQSDVGKMARMFYLKQGVHGRGESQMEGSGDKRSVGQRLYQIG